VRLGLEDGDGEVGRVGEGEGECECVSVCDEFCVPSSSDNDDDDNISTRPSISPFSNTDTGADWLDSSSP
jgi:hypothetical protein